MRLPETKRFVELFAGDPVFRKAVVERDSQGVTRWGLELDEELARALVDGPSAGDRPGADPLRTYRAHLEVSRRRVREATAGVGRGTPYGAWRTRQINRVLSQTNPTGWGNPHFPYAVELSKGCSIGCDYCCFDAPRVSAVARHDNETALLFREVLDVLAGFCGEGAENGFLYWATEPLDNPDYEQYLQSFFERFGVWPRTTTAAWHRDLARTHRLLAVARSHGAPNGVRFSVNTLAQLHTCFATFSAADLLDVQLTLQNPESTGVKCAAGRAAVHHPEAAVDTNSNVTGVLVNLVERSAKLISPSSDLAQWPLGYAVFASGRFEDALSLDALLRTWEQRIIADRLCDEFVPRLRPDLRLKIEEQRTVLATTFAEIAFTDEIERAILHTVDGVRSVATIVRGLLPHQSAWAVYTRFRRLYASGLFEDMPLGSEAGDARSFTTKRSTPWIYGSSSGKNGGSSWFGLGTMTSSVSG